MPKCIPVQSTDLSASFTGGIAACTGDFYGDSCTIQCQSNSELTGGAEKVYCGADGEWANVPECRAITCEIPLNLFDEMSLGACDSKTELQIGASCQVGLSSFLPFFYQT